MFCVEVFYALYKFSFIHSSEHSKSNFICSTFCVWLINHIYICKTFLRLNLLVSPEPERECMCVRVCVHVRAVKILLYMLLAFREPAYRGKHVTLVAKWLPTVLVTMATLTWNFPASILGFSELPSQFCK